jgi:hypothetical protein
MTMNIVKINHIELNTVSNPTPGFMDESPRIWCQKCRNWLREAEGIGFNPVIQKLTDKHLELCTGHIGHTLLLVQKWYRDGGDKELEFLAHEEDLRLGRRRQEREAGMVDRPDLRTIGESMLEWLPIAFKDYNPSPTRTPSIREIIRLHAQ